MGGVDATTIMTARGAGKGDFIPIVSESWPDTLKG